MKRFFFIISLVVFGLILTMSSAQAEGEMIETDESMYNLDPYYWVYGASQYTWMGNNPNVWPAEGHDLSVGFSLAGYQAGDSLTFSVAGLEEGPVGGSMTEDNGVYRGTFDVTEASVGGELFKAGVLDDQGAPLLPRSLTLTISNTTGAVAERQIEISRWACDRCHLDQQTAMEVYPWCAPAGGPLGPHIWPNVLGRNGGRPGFTYENLTTDRLTHTPTVGGYATDGTWLPNPLDRPPYHQKTNVKLGGSELCSPCHQGSGRIRHAWGDVEGEWFVYSMEKSMEVKCVFCHNINSGYVPRDINNPQWENNLLKGWN